MEFFLKYSRHRVGHYQYLLEGTPGDWILTARSQMVSVIIPPASGTTLNEFLPVDWQQ